MQHLDDRVHYYRHIDSRKDREKCLHSYTEEKRERMRRTVGVQCRQTEGEKYVSKCVFSPEFMSGIKKSVCKGI